MSLVLRLSLTLLVSRWRDRLGARPVSVRSCAALGPLAPLVCASLSDGLTDGLRDGPGEAGPIFEMKRALFAGRSGPYFLGEAGPICGAKLALLA